MLFLDLIQGGETLSFRTYMGEEIRQQLCPH